MSEARFAKLLSPIEIGRLKVKNRMVHAPRAMLLGDDSGCVNDANKLYYETLARGGVGLIISEAVPMAFPLSVTGPGRFRIDDDKFLPGLTELVQVIHKHNCPVIIQLHHAGPSHNPKGFGTQPIASSSLTRSELPLPEHAEPRGLTIAEIENLVGQYVLVAERARKAGFDGVEVHAGHAYLLNSFLSRAWNKRQDAYGGDLVNRARFLVQVIQAIKQRTGSDYPLGVRINGAEYGSKDGLTPDESQEIASIIQKAGANYVSVSAFGFNDYLGLVYPEQIFSPAAPKPFPEGLDKSHKGAGGLVPLAAGIKKAVSIPVIAVGRLDPILGEEVLQQGKADLVAFARRLIADPQLPNKVASGRLDDITPCLACARCTGCVPLGVPVRCTVNPEVGKERENAIKPAREAETGHDSRRWTGRDGGSQSRSPSRT